MKYAKLFLFLFALNIAGCKSSGEPVDKYFFEMGTIVHLNVEKNKAKDLDKVAEYMKQLTEKINQDQLNINSAKIGEKVKVSPLFSEIYNMAEEYYGKSNGIYDPTSITVASLYGFPEGELTLPKKEDIEKAKLNAGLKNLNMQNGYIVKNKNTMVDLSANAKGYLVDKTVAFMKEKGFKNFIVNSGGDLFISGEKYGKQPFKVSIEDPDNKNGFVSIIKLTNEAVATSGNYERFFITPDNKRITHIFSGVTFESSNNYKSVSVIAKTTEKADGLATLYFLSNIEQIKNYCQQFSTPVLIITQDNAKVKLCNWDKYEE